METPIQIEFQGMEPVEHVRSAIARHIIDLESRFGRVTACRVVLKSPAHTIAPAATTKSTFTWRYPMGGKSISTAPPRPTHGRRTFHLP